MVKGSTLAIIALGGLALFLLFKGGEQRGREDAEAIKRATGYYPADYLPNGAYWFDLRSDFLAGLSNVFPRPPTTMSEEEIRAFYTRR